jgi:hypothetical protein
MGWLHYHRLSVTRNQGRDFNGARDLMRRYLYRESGEDKSLRWLRANVVGPSLRSGFNELPITQFQDASQYGSGFHSGGTVRRNLLRSARPHDPQTCELCDFMRDITSFASKYGTVVGNINTAIPPKRINCVDAGLTKGVQGPLPKWVVTAPWRSNATLSHLSNPTPLSIIILTEICGTLSRIQG